MIGLSFAKKAKLDDTIDRRSREIISGVGGADKLVGQIHSCKISHTINMSNKFKISGDMQIGSIKIKAKLEVIIDDFDILIGLDILRLYRGFIDLQYGRFLVFKDPF